MHVILQGMKPPRPCANPPCYNTIDPELRKGAPRIYCSAECRRAVRNARQVAANTGRRYPPPVLIKTRAQHLRAYFDLLMRLAQRAEGERLTGLLSRMERTLSAMEAQAASPRGTG